MFLFVLLNITFPPIRSYLREFTFNLRSPYGSCSFTKQPRGAELISHYREVCKLAFVERRLLQEAFNEVKVYRSRYGRDKRPDCRTKVVVAGGLIVFGLYLDCEQSLFCWKVRGANNAKKNTTQVSSCELTSVICERHPTPALLVLSPLASHAFSHARTGCLRRG